VRNIPEDPSSEELQLRRELLAGVNRLRFAGELEREFREHHFHETLPQVRISLTLGLAAYLAFGALDAVVFPELRATLWRLRYLIAAPPVVAAWLYALSRRPRPLLHRLYAGVFVWVGAVLVALLAMVPPDRGQLYYPSLILLTFHVLAFSGLRAATSVPGAWAVFGVYAAAEPLAIHSDTIHLANNLGGLFAANVVGCAAAYMIERAQRRAFLQERLLELESSRHAELARIDPLTGLANRRRFDRALEEEWSRARRLGYPLALLMIDIDAFKAYNDALGHQAGDACLRRVAAAVAAWARRPGDLAARYGGEELVLLLPGTGPAEAVNVAEEVRRQVRALHIEHPGSPVAPWVTVSVGCAAAVPAPGEAAEDLLGGADAALYRAKRAGRDRVEVADGGG